MICSTCASSSSAPSARHGAGEAEDFVAWVALSRHAKLQAKAVRPSELEAASALMNTAKVAAVPLVVANHMLAH